MSKEKAIEKIHKSIDILKWYRVSKNEKNKAVCFLREALKELEGQNMEKIYKGEIQRLLPIFQAMADGRIIQVSENGNDWIDIDGEEAGLYIDTLIDNPQCYRIKPEPKYRPFLNAEECLTEMQKHQLFGWVKIEDLYRNIAK